jgi:hypothetical protein
MDYRYYRGEMPAWMQKLQTRFGRYLYRLKAVGVGLMLFGIIIPFLMVIKVIESTFFFNFLAWGMSSLGMVSYIVGFLWDNIIDRN